MKLPPSSFPRVNKAFYAFIVPFIFRAIIEIYAAPYTIGYDTVAEYVPILSGVLSIFNNFIFEISSLYYVITLPLQYLLQNPILTVKVFAIFLEGLFGLSLYFWGKTFLSTKNALFLSLVASFYFSTLRIAWDLQRNILGLCLVFMTIYVLESVKSTNLKFSLSVILTILAVMADPLVLPVLLILLFPYMIKKDKIVISAAIISIVFFTISLYVVIGSASSIFNLLVKQFDVFQPNEIFPSGLSALGFLLFLMLPLIPFLYKAVKSISKDKTAIDKLMPPIFLFVGLLMLSVIMFWGYRFALMAPIAAIAIITYYLGNNHRTQRKIIISVTIIFAIGFCAFQYPYTFPYYSMPSVFGSQFSYAFPGSMLQNTVPLADSHVVNSLFVYANHIISSGNKTSVILVNEPMLFYAITSHSNNTYYYGQQFVDSKPIIKTFHDNGYSIYIVWWQSGKQWYNLDFTQVLQGYNYSVIYEKGDYAIYYVAPS